MFRFHLPLAVLFSFAFSVLSAQAAELPAHEAFSILVVADEVNPHGLSDEELTQPGDFASALGAADSGLMVSAVETVDSQCIDEALAALNSPSHPTVVLYFAHRAARRCDGTDAQGDLTESLRSAIISGMGLVAFHHGLYIDLYSPGAKAELLLLIGAQAEGISWNTATGQRVFNVAGGHFIADNGTDYPEQGAFVGTETVEAGEYPYFDNIPDEIYPQLTVLSEAGEIRTPLFATDSGGEHLLGYALAREGWQGRVVAYQPGEYQPNALDDRQGNGFQILANALFYAAFGDAEPEMGTGAGGSSAGGAPSSSALAGGSSPNPNPADGTAVGGTPSVGGATPVSPIGGGSPGAASGGAPEGILDGEPSFPQGSGGDVSEDSVATGGSSMEAVVGEGGAEPEGGCGIARRSGPFGLPLFLGFLLVWRQRWRSARR